MDKNQFTPPQQILKQNSLANNGSQAQNLTSVCPSIAIVLPVYNVERYLPECLDSILSQTYKNFTVFAVDDGATDNSGKILDGYASRDHRIKVIHKQNGGVSSARNIALEFIESGKFDYVCFIDPDDYISPVYLERFIAAIRQYSPDIAFCGEQTFDRNGLINDRKPLIKARNPYNHESLISRLIGSGEWNGTYIDTTSLSNLMISSNLLYGERFESISNGEDTLFNIKITLKANTGAYVDEILYFYRQRKGSLSRNKDKTLSALVFCEHFFDFPDSVRPFLATCIFSLTRESIEMSITEGIVLPKERMQRILDFMKTNIYRTKYDENFRRKCHKMVSWPFPIFRFYTKWFRKNTINTTNKFDLFD